MACTCNTYIFLFKMFASYGLIICLLYLNLSYCTAGSCARSKYLQILRNSIAFANSLTITRILLYKVEKLSIRLSVCLHFFGGVDLGRGCMD